MKTERKLASQEETLMPFDRSWLLRSKYLDHHLLNKEPFSQEVHSKRPLWSRSSKMSNSYSCCWIKHIIPMAFWHRAHSGKCSSQLLIPRLTPLSLLRSESEFEIVMQLANPRNDHLHFYSLRLETYRAWRSVQQRFRRSCEEVLRKTTRAWRRHPEQQQQQRYSAQPP
jgi:hypothetical protein